MIFIVITVLIDTAGVGIILPVLPKLLTNMSHADMGTAARYGGWLTFVYALMQFVFAPVLGNLSDAYGRRPVLLCSLLGFSLDYIFLAFAPSFFWFFIGRTISGITGASYVVGSTYMADISSGEERTKNFGWLNAAMGIGFILGPAIGGLLAQFGLHAPFIAAAALSSLNLILGYFVLPESLALENRRPFDWKKANPLGAIKYLRNFKGAAVLIASLLFLSFASHSMETIWTFFTTEKFHWRSSLTGLSLACMGGLFIVVQGWLVGFSLKALKEKGTAYVGLFFTFLAYLSFALTPWQWGLFAALVIFAIGTIGETALQGILSNSAPANEQGELQGSFSCLKGLVTIIAPLAFANIFATFSHQGQGNYFPGMPFLLAAATVLISLLLFIKADQKYSPEDDPRVENKEEISSSV